MAASLFVQKFVQRFPQVFMRKPPRQFVCSSPECHIHPIWRRLRNDDGIVVLQGHRLCFPHCFQKELSEVLAANPARVPRETPGRRRIPLGLLLLSQGVVNEQQLRRALDAQQRAGERKIGEWLIQMKAAKELEITAGLARQWACPLMKELPASLPKVAIPWRLLVRFRMVPVHLVNAGTLLHVAFAGDIDYRALVSIESILRVRTEACLTTESQLGRALEGLEQSISERLFENCDGPDEITRVISDYTARARAREVRYAACGEFFWCKLLGGDSVDLLFKRKDAGATFRSPVDDCSSTLREGERYSAKATT